MAPMTRPHSPGGVATKEVADYYRRRAEAGVGLITSEGQAPGGTASLNDPDVPRFSGEKELAGWATLIEPCIAAGGVWRRSSGIQGLRTRGTGPYPDAP